MAFLSGDQSYGLIYIRTLDPQPSVFTALSIPKVSSMMKKMTAQTEEPGNVAMASG